MEAPEKIFVTITQPLSDEYTEMIAFEHGDGIEYTRTDAFIEKAFEWMSSQLQMQYDCFSSFIKDFRKSMKEEK